MAELHQMKVRWSGASEVVAKLVEVAQRHGCKTNVEQDGDNASLCASLADTDLQVLRDRVDALLVDFADVEEHHNG
ncbi:MAG: hypothetical protein QF531_00235 [Candidatus Poseidonia sp.]|nr:hypothetical protein [Poseidonia sp.]